MATYGFTPDDHALAVQWIERSSVDREKAGSVMLAAGYLLAVVAGGLLVHLASINNIILLWLDKPTTVLGICFRLAQVYGRCGSLIVKHYQYQKSFQTETIAQFKTVLDIGGC